MIICSVDDLTHLNLASDALVDIDSVAFSGDKSELPCDVLLVLSALEQAANDYSDSYIAPYDKDAVMSINNLQSSNFVLDNKDHWCDDVIKSFLNNNMDLSMSYVLNSKGGWETSSRPAQFSGSDNYLTVKGDFLRPYSDFIINLGLTSAGEVHEMIVQDWTIALRLKSEIDNQYLAVTLTA